MPNSDQNISQLESVVDLILHEAKACGADAAEAGASMERGISASVRLGEVETIENNRDCGIGITLYFENRKGSASTTDISTEAIKKSVRAAADIARYTEPDEYAGLADKDLMAWNYPNLDLDHSWNPSPEEAIEVALECEDAARATDKRIVNSEGATVNSHRDERVYGNSHGFCGGFSSTRHSISCAVVAQDDDSENSPMERDYWFSSNRNHNKLEPATVIGERAAQRTLRRLSAKRLTTRAAPVIFAAEVASSLVSHLLSAISGGSQYRKSSFLLDQLGEKIFPENITIEENPLLIGGLNSAPFDGEGVITSKKEIISNGVLASYLLSSYSARKLGRETTGNAGGARNLSVVTETKSAADIMQDMGSGLLVTELIGQGVNGVTGDYSRGAAGFWVENGVISYPVSEITIAGNLKDIYNSIVAVGDDVDERGNISTGSILIKEMSIAGE